MPAWWSGTAEQFLAAPPDLIVDHLVLAQARHFRTSEAAARDAWTGSVELLQRALREFAGAPAWRVLLEYPMLRLGRRADAILVGPRGIIVLEFKVGAKQVLPADRRQAEDFALDLQDFHAGSGAHPIVPVLCASETTREPQSFPFFFCGKASDVLSANGDSLGGLLASVAPALPADRRLIPRHGNTLPIVPYPRSLKRRVWHTIVTECQKSLKRAPTFETYEIQPMPFEPRSVKRNAPANI